MFIVIILIITMTFLVCFKIDSPDFNPIETNFANVKNWCRQHAGSCRALGMSDAAILKLAFQSIRGSVDATILSNEYTP